MKKIAIFAFVALLAGCSSNISLNEAGNNVMITESTSIDKGCQLIGDVEGSQSTFFSGDNEANSYRGAMNDLRNKTAKMGGNMVYGVAISSNKILSSFAPLPSKVVGKAYKCRDVK